jgi:low temperature requirement protein LtrA
MPETAPPVAPSRPAGTHRLIRMSGRRTDEQHRVATPLELLFDLTFVVAFGFAGNELAHAIVAGQVGDGLIGFAFAMFATCWAWINFSWFASAFDTDDWLYRIVTMVQMVGVLILALGIPPLFSSLVAGAHLNITGIVIGYVVMRIAMVVQWLRAARQCPANRRAALTYVVAIVAAQIGWVTLIFLDITVLPLLLCALALDIVEGLGPVIAERRQPTPWHAEHIADRYSALAIIALGEGVVGAAAALSAVIEVEHGWTWEVASVGLAGIGLTLGMWWSYFTLPSGEALQVARGKGFVWGYGQILVFAAIAATGAGLHVAALQMEQPAAAGEAAAGGAAAAEAHVGVSAAVLAVAVPVAVFTVALYGLYTYLVGQFDRFHLLLLGGTVVVLALAVLLATTGVPLPICLLLLALAPAVTVVGYETVGHAHQERVLERLRSGVADRPAAAEPRPAPR